MPNDVKENVKNVTKQTLKHMEEMNEMRMKIGN